MYLVLTMIVFTIQLLVLNNFLKKNLHVNNLYYILLVGIFYNFYLKFNTSKKILYDSETNFY